MQSKICTINNEEGTFSWHEIRTIPGAGLLRTIAFYYYSLAKGIHCIKLEVVIATTCWGEALLTCHIYFLTSIYEDPASLL